MQTAAVTSQAALTDSPRVSATTAKEIAPKTATAVHVSFSRNVTVPSPESRLAGVRSASDRTRGQALFHYNILRGIKAPCRRAVLTVSDASRAEDGPHPIDPKGEVDAPYRLRNNDHPRAAQELARRRLRPACAESPRARRHAGLPRLQKLFNPALTERGHRRHLADRVAFRQKPDRLKMPRRRHVLTRFVTPLRLRNAQMIGNVSRASLQRIMAVPSTST